MLDRGPAVGAFERDGDHVDPHAAVFEPVAADVGVGELGDSPLLLVADGLGRMTVIRVGSRSHFDEHHRAVVERDQVDVAPEHPLAAGDDPVADALEIAGRLVLAATAELVARLHGGLRRSQALAAAFLADFFVLPASATTSSRFSRRRTALPTRSRR